MRRASDRWHDLSLYRVGGGGYVVQIEYSTNWQGELGHTLTEQAGSPAEVAGILEGYDSIGDPFHVQ